MKALAIQQYGGPNQLNITEIPLPLPERGEVLVRVHAAGINPVDYKIRNGSMRAITGKKFPVIPGGDVAGVVEQVSSRNSSFRAGDRVFALLAGGMGAYAEFITVKEKHLCHIPDGLSMTDAAATPMAALTALQGMQIGDTVLSGERVLINGASGGVGSFAVQIAKAMGAYVTAVCSTKNIDFVKQLGADHVIDYTSENFTKTNNKYHRVFDAVGKSSYARSKKILEKKGIYVSTLPGFSNIMHRILNFSSSRKSFVLMVKPSAGNLQIIADFISKGEVKPQVERIFTFDQGALAHEVIQSGRVRGKIVFAVIP